MMFLEKVYLGVKNFKKLRDEEVDDDGYLSHHGIKGQQWGIRNGPPYPIHRDAAYNTANDIYDKLDTFDYGCIIDGKRYNETNLDEVNWSKYRTTPVEDFEKTKIGTCWDFTNYQHEKLKEAGVDHTTRMIVMDTDIGPVTHTFTTFQDSTGQKYWLEQALYSERGIHPIDDYTDAVDVISKRYDPSKKRAFDVYEFNPDGMDKGLSDREFFNRATSGDPIFQRKENTDSNIDISTKNWMRINEFYKSMSYKDRKLIDPDSTYESENYFKSLDQYKKTTAYNFISDDGFLVAEKIPKNQNVDGTNGVEIGIGVKDKGKGIGTKMVGDLVNWFDDQNDIDTMWWPVDKSNKASIRIAEKNGFIKDPLGSNYIYAKDSAYEKLGINNKRKEPAKSSNDILKQYNNQTLTKDAIREYKSQAPQLSHVRVNKNTTGELYFKNGKLAGMVNTEKKDDGTIWIQGIEVYGDNQGKGLGYSMLDHAVKDLGATNLSVNKKNDRAKMIYDKYGFETYDEDSTMYYMKYE